MRTIRIDNSSQIEEQENRPMFVDTNLTQAWYGASKADKDKSCRKVSTLSKPYANSMTIEVEN